MKNALFTKISLGCLLGLLAIIAGCCIHIGSCWSRAKYEKIEQLSAPLAVGSTVVAETNFGSITVTGADVADCNVVAKIRVQAPTKQEAAEIAEQVKIRLESDGKTLTIRADKPHLKNNRSVGISYQITVPRQSNIECDSSYGSIKLTNITGDVNAHTSYGSINCASVNGKMQLDTSYGRVGCSDIVADELSVRSSYGNINIEYSDMAPAEIQANVRTSYGGIDFTAPPGFAGQVELVTSYSSIKTDLPITVKGKISNNRIKGTIGQGQGKLKLKTSFGSIRIR